MASKDFGQLLPIRQKRFAKTKPDRNQPRFDQDGLLLLLSTAGTADLPGRWGVAVIESETASSKDIPGSKG